MMRFTLMAHIAHSTHYATVVFCAWLLDMIEDQKSTMFQLSHILIDITDHCVICQHRRWRHWAPRSTKDLTSLRKTLDACIFISYEVYELGNIMFLTSWSHTITASPLRIFKTSDVSANLQKPCWVRATISPKKKKKKKKKIKKKKKTGCDAMHHNQA